MSFLPQQRPSFGNLLMKAIPEFAQQYQTNKQDEHMNKVFAANPDFAMKLYAAKTNAEQNALRSKAIEQENSLLDRNIQKENALAKLAEMYGQGITGPNGKMDLNQLLTQSAAITGDFSPLVKYAMGQTGSDAPSNVQTALWYENATPEQRAIFDRTNKNIIGTMDVGGNIIQYDRTTGQPIGNIDKTLAPADVPENAAAKVAAMEEAKLAEQLKTEPLITSANKAAELEATASADLLKKSKNAQNTIDILQKAEILLPKATGGLGGAVVSSTKGALDISDESTQANEELKLLSGWLVSNVPRMEGPQSNYDVGVYKTMAADLGNQLKSKGDRMAALNTLMLLQAKYADLNQDKNNQTVPEGTIQRNKKTGAQRIMRGGKWEILP